MTVPDQRHINQVREALWHRPGAGASVMIGSGFSRNARRVRPGSKQLPMLDEIASHLSAKLYPDEGADEKIPQERILRLAQEYEAEFSPIGLHEALRRMVADDDFMPGGFHERLLGLPWADVFTTNWDRLLERSKAVRDRGYTIVQSKNDIPQGHRPRIVKLHGSLPNPRLILTEEDYRTYPAEFSPFVNTVQQAMMETTFVLIGFSGNDPNFLHWLGWVRDNLVEAAPTIYLAGFLELSRPQRQMLQRYRNVVAIDLARHPKAPQWPEHLQHHYATEWILSTLECGQPYKTSEWPSPRDEAFCSEENPLLQPIVRNVSAEPRAEPLGPPHQVSAEARLATAKTTLDIWKHNRKCYPDWLVAPVRVRNERRVSTELWAPFIVPELAGLAVLERLDAIREIIWRYDLILARIPDDLKAAAEAVLDSIDCTERTVEGNRPDDVDWKVIRAAWREVALALLTAARHRLDGAAFDKQLNALESFLGDDVEVAHRVCHERCLWELWSLDHATLEERLDAWRTDECDPAWAMRKSALLREIGRKEEANQLIERTLDEIRAITGDGRDLAGPSREGWALWSLVETFAIADDFQARWDNVQARWDELAALKCDASSDVRYLRDELSVSRRETQPPAFDLGGGLTETRLASPSSPSAAAYRGIRLTEVAGLPPSIDVVTIAGGMVKWAAEALMIEDATTGIRQMIRVTTSDRDKAFMRVLARPRVASLTPATAKALARDVQIALEDAISRIRQAGSERNLYDVRRASVSMESLSRLVLRLDAPAVLSVFDLALNLHKDQAVMSWFWLLDNAMRNLLRRCWESLDDERHAERVLDVLEMPIVGLDGFGTDRDQWPDPGEILSEDLSPPVRSEDNEDRWAVVVATLIRGLGSEGQARKRAARRIADIAVWGRLKKVETGRVAEALWSSVADEGQGLPDGTPLRDYAFILLPEPTVGMGRARFGRRWLSGDVAKVRLTPIHGGQAIGGEVVHTDSTRADDILWQAGMSIAFVRRHGRTLDLTNAENEYLIRVIEQWSQTRVPKSSALPEFFQSLAKRSIWDAYRGLRWILTEIEVSSDLAGKLYSQAEESIDSGIPAYSILPGIANVSESLHEDVALLMSTGLASDDRKMGESAMWSLHCWMRFASDGALDFIAPPQQLIREVGVSVVMRRRTVLGQALYAAKWVFEHGSEDAREAIRDLVLKGLGYLTEELRYDREDPFDGRLDVPLARWRSIQVARAMAGQGLREHPVIRRWLQLGMDDPLPEVRHVANRWREGDAMVGSDGRHEVADEGAADA